MAQYANTVKVTRQQFYFNKNLLLFHLTPFPTYGLLRIVDKEADRRKPNMTINNLSTAEEAHAQLKIEQRDRLVDEEKNHSGVAGKVVPDEASELVTGLPMYLDCAMCDAGESFVISKQDPSTGYCFAEKREWTLVAGEQRKFRQHLDDASAEVATWPKWEQEILGRAVNERFTSRTSPLTGKPYPQCQMSIDSAQCMKPVYAEGKCYKHFQRRTDEQKG